MYPTDDELDVISERPVADLYRERRLEASRLAQMQALSEMYTNPLVASLKALGRNPQANSILTNDVQDLSQSTEAQSGTGLLTNSFAPTVTQPQTVPEQSVSTERPQYVATSALPERTGSNQVQSSGKNLSAGVEQWRPMVTEIANKYGVDPNVALSIMQIESQGKAGIKNGKGAPYGGLFQISTSIKGWDDPRVNTEHAMKQMASRTNMFKKSFGRAPTAGELYLLQQQGEGGAMALLNPKNANRPVEQVLAEVDEWKRRYGGDPNKVLKHVVMTNGGKAGMTASQFASQWVNKADSIYAGKGTQQVASNSKTTQQTQRKVLAQETKPQSKKEYKRQILTDEASNIKTQMDEIQKHMGLPNVNQITLNALQNRFKDLKLTYDAINREKGSI